MSFYVNSLLIYFHLFAQLMQELAVMMELPKKQVLETVNENKADELSAMFNMLLDEKKKVLGEYGGQDVQW